MIISSGIGFKIPRSKCCTIKMYFRKSDIECTIAEYYFLVLGSAKAVLLVIQRIQL